MISAVFPNPATNNINISLNDRVKNGAEIIIFDLNGQVVYRETINNKATTQINVSNLSQGLYQLVVNNNGQLSRPEKLAIIK